MALATRLPAILHPAAQRGHPRQAAGRLVRPHPHLLPPQSPLPALLSRPQHPRPLPQQEDRPPLLRRPSGHSPQRNGEEEARRMALAKRQTKARRAEPGTEQVCDKAVGLTEFLIEQFKFNS